MPHLLFDLRLGHILDLVQRLAHPTQLFEPVFGLLYDRLNPSGKVASLSEGSPTKYFICTLTYPGLNWPGSEDSKTIVGPKHDLESVLRSIGFVHGDPMFVVITDFDWMYDGVSVQAQRTTRVDIEQAMRDFIASLSSHDKAFILFSGHGEVVTIPRSGLQAQGRAALMPALPSHDQLESTQALLATDFKHSESAISSSVLRNLIVDALPPGAALVVVIDACSSGNILQLPGPNNDQGGGMFLKPRPPNEIILIAGAEIGKRAYSEILPSGCFGGVLTDRVLAYIGDHPNTDVNGLRTYLTEECRKLTKHEGGGPQQPVVSLSNPSIGQVALL
ncbi:hypothetical protein FRB99_005361 [Tulasnella sp. 403]|nr:hypothetical protein FRB99_005361 [Tulasnella sp. 403]